MGDGRLRCWPKSCQDSPGPEHQPGILRILFPKQLSCQPTSLPLGLLCPDHHVFSYFFVLQPTLRNTFFLAARAYAPAHAHTCIFIVIGYLYLKFYSFFFFLLLGPHPQRMEVPRLGAESELQLLAYTTATAIATWDPNHIFNPHHSSQQHQIPEPLRPGIELASSWILVGFISTAPQWEFPKILFLLHMM